MLRFAIIDSGIGISEEGRKKLFQDFSQVDSSISRRYGGTGLGLSICKKIITVMDGEIGVESEENIGSEFWFEIPSKLTDAPEVDFGDNSGGIVQQLPRLKILIAEDNKVNQQVAVGLLGNKNHDITLVENGLEAVYSCEEHQYDVVLMDMQMPEMDGLTATKKIKGLASKNSNTPIIALTANAMSSDQDKCIEAGMIGFVSKPIKSSVLMQEIARVTGVLMTEEVVEVEYRVEMNFFDSEQLMTLEQAITKAGVISVLKMYVEEVLPLGEGIYDVALSSNWQQLMFDAHKIKGSSANLAMDKVAEMAGEIEELTRDGRTADAVKIAKEILNYMKNTLTEAATLYPQSFEEVKNEEAIGGLSASLSSALKDGFEKMQVAISNKSVDSYEDASSTVLTLDLPREWMSSLGEVDKLVYDEEFEKAVDALTLLAKSLGGSNGDDCEGREQIEALEHALGLSKPKGIAVAVSDLKEVTISGRAKGVVDQAFVKIGNYQYSEAQQILVDYLKEG